MNAFGAALLALVAEGGGVLTGILLLYLFHIKSKRLIGMLFGTTSGIMIAMICFDVLPHALESGDWCANGNSNRNFFRGFYRTFRR